MADQELESIVDKLEDLDSLQSLFIHLGYAFADEPVDKETWNDDEKSTIEEARVIAKKDDYRIYYLQTKHWKGISTKIIKENHGLCLICSHNPNELKWVFSSRSESSTKPKNIPIEVRPEKRPKTFVDFLEKITITKEDTPPLIMAKMFTAFDLFPVSIHDEPPMNKFEELEALKRISEGIISDKNNNLTSSNETLEIQEALITIVDATKKRLRRSEKNEALAFLHQEMKFSPAEIRNMLLQLKVNMNQRQILKSSAKIFAEKPVPSWSQGL